MQHATVHSSFPRHKIITMTVEGSIGQACSLTMLVVKSAVRSLLLFTTISPATVCIQVVRGQRPQNAHAAIINQIMRTQIQIVACTVVIHVA